MWPSVPRRRRGGWAARRHLSRLGLRGRLEEEAGGDEGIWRRRQETSEAAEVGSATAGRGGDRAAAAQRLMSILEWLGIYDPVLTLGVPGD